MSKQSDELQLTGAILFLLGGIFLVAPIGLNTISSITGIEVNLLQIVCVIGIIGGIGLFVMGLRSRKQTG